MEEPSLAQVTGLSEAYLIAENDRLSMRKKLELIRELCVSAELLYGDIPPETPLRPAAYILLFSVSAALLAFLAIGTINLLT